MAEEYGKWISVSAELPREGQSVLIACLGQVCLGWRRQKYSKRQSGWGSYFRTPRETEVTHWMPLPDPPKV